MNQKNGRARKIRVGDEFEESATKLNGQSSIRYRNRCNGKGYSIPERTDFLPTCISSYQDFGDETVEWLLIFRDRKIGPWYGLSKGKSPSQYQQRVIAHETRAFSFSHRQRSLQGLKIFFYVSPPGRELSIQLSLQLFMDCIPIGRISYIIPVNSM